MTDPVVLAHLEHIQSGIVGIHERLDALNGRTRDAEVDIGILKARASDARREAQSEGRNSGAKWGAGISAAIAALITAIWQAWQAIGGGK